MEPMRKPTRLQKRNHRFYCRVAVPHALRPVLGRSEVIKALKTGDHAVALRRLSLASAEVDAMFAQARRKLRAGPATTLDDHEIKQLALLWFHETERKATKTEATPGHTMDRAEALTQADDDLATLADTDDSDTLAAVQAEVDRLLAENNVRLDEGDAAYGLLCGLIARGMAEATRRSRDRLLGNHSARHHDPAFEGVGPDAAAPHTPQGARLTLAGLVDEYMSEPQQQAVTGKTRAGRLAMFRVLTAILGGETLVADVGRQDARRVRDTILALPPNSMKRWPDLAPEQAAAMARERGERPMSTTMSNAYLSNFASLFRHAVRERGLPSNHFDGLRVKSRGPGPRYRRLPFTREHLRAIFDQPLYRGCVDDLQGYDKPGPNVVRGDRFWSFLIALYAGLRMEEILQLAVEDIERRDGVWCFVVRRGGDGDKRVKTEAGERLVPVHGELRRCGFLDYVAEMRRRDERSLFPRLPVGRWGSRSDKFSKWAGRFLHKAGVKDGRRSFHSLRHNFRDAMAEGGVSRDAVLALGGWSSGHTSDIYGGGLRPRTLLREISKVRYDLDLGHLCPR